MSQSNSKVERAARLRWVPIADMKVSPLVTQRERLNEARVDKIAANLDVEQIGSPIVCEHDGTFWILDGWHRIEALKKCGWGDQQVQCWTYVDLTEAEMAEVFLKTNDNLPVSAMDKFRVGVVAGREVECDIDRIVRAQGCNISSSKSENSIQCIGAVRSVYSRGGAKVLARTIRIGRDSFGDAGLERDVITGIGLVCQRYNGELDDDRLVEKLASVRGGANGLMNLAGVTRRQTGASWGHSVADAIVQTYNRGRGGKKLPDWWKADA